MRNGLATDWTERRTATLTLRDTLDIATVIDWAQKTQRVRWLTDSGDIATGTVRCIGTDQGAYLRSDDDVRDGFVRITTSGGFEWFPTMADVVAMVRNGTIAADS